MTTARTEQIQLNATPYYHCTTRCVRRAFLCGQDRETGKDYAHRKEWLIARFQNLTTVFAIQICAYAVMDNHYHLVLFVDEAQVPKWNDEEVHRRWSELFPQDAKQWYTLNCKELMQEKIALWRTRLMDISWFMRCINEPLARQANKEDDCKGRFWEGRFKSQALLDEGALLSAMAYVDLNPIRAKVAITPETSEFTSIYERIQKRAQHTTLRIDKAPQPARLMPFSNDIEQEKSTLDFSLSDYLILVDCAGRMLRDNKPGVIPSNLPPILERLYLNTQGWFTLIKNLENTFAYAVGHVAHLLNFRSSSLSGSPRGVGIARRCYLQAA